MVVAVAYKVPAPASAASAEEGAAPIGERDGSFKRGKETATQAGSLPRGQEPSDRGEWSTRWSRVMPAVAHGALLTLSETLTLTLHHHRSNWFDFPDMRVAVFAVADGHAGKFTRPPQRSSFRSCTTKATTQPRSSFAVLQMVSQGRVADLRSPTPLAAMYQLPPQSSPPQSLPHCPS